MIRTVRHSEAEVDEFADEHEDKQHPSASADQQPVTAHHWAMETLTKSAAQHKTFRIIHITWGQVSLYDVITEVRKKATEHTYYGSNTSLYPILISILGARVSEFQCKHFHSLHLG